VYLFSDHNDLASLAVPIEIERDMRIALDILVAHRTRQAVYEHRVPAPQEPDRIGVRRAIGTYRRKPNDQLVPQATGDALAKWSRRWWQNARYRSSSHLVP
jgi:hypothetical protein